MIFCRKKNGKISVTGKGTVVYDAGVMETSIYGHEGIIYKVTVSVDNNSTDYECSLVVDDPVLNENVVFILSGDIYLTKWTLLDNSRWPMVIRAGGFVVKIEIETEID